ncbi:unnamed protein product [Choristocarpus tenellus]
MARWRSDAEVPPLRSLSLNRTATEIGEATRGTLFFKVIEGTDLVSPPPAPERKARWTTFLSDSLGVASAAATGAVHAINIVASLEVGIENFSATSGDPGRLFSQYVKAAIGGSAGEGSPVRSTGFGGQVGGGNVVVRTSNKFISPTDKGGHARWNEEFFFGKVSGVTTVKITCVDKV